MRFPDRKSFRRNEGYHVLMFSLCRPPGTRKGLAPDRLSNFQAQGRYLFHRDGNDYGFEWLFRPGDSHPRGHCDVVLGWKDLSKDIQGPASIRRKFRRGRKFRTFGLCCRPCIFKGFPGQADQGQKTSVFIATVS